MFPHLSDQAAVLNDHLEYQSSFRKDAGYVIVIWLSSSVLLTVKVYERCENL